MASTLKGEERVILEWKGTGGLEVKLPTLLNPHLQTVYAEAIRTGEVRGYVSDPSFSLPIGTPLGYALGPGTLTGGFHFCMV